MRALLIGNKQVKVSQLFILVGLPDHPLLLLSND